MIPKYYFNHFLNKNINYCFLLNWVQSNQYIQCNLVKQLSSCTVTSLFRNHCSQNIKTPSKNSLNSFQPFHRNMNTNPGNSTNFNIPSNSLFSSKNLIWADCEMTGLDESKDSIMEIACVITDLNLNILDKLEIIIHKSDEVLRNMNEWCLRHHNESGLVEKCRTSLISTIQADEKLFNFISKYVPERSAPLVGSTIYMDRLFIRKEFPKFNEYLHYRIIDVSSLKLLCTYYNEGLMEKLPTKRMKHRGLEDIEDSINELKFYKEYFLRTANEKDEFGKAVPMI